MKRLLVIAMLALPIQHAVAQHRIACNLSVFTPAERTRHRALIVILKAAIAEQAELPDGYGFRLARETISLTSEKSLHVIFANDAVRTGQDWDAIRAALREWLTTAARFPKDSLHHVQVAGVPFPVDVMQWSGGKPAVYFGRYSRVDHIFRVG